MVGAALLQNENVNQPPGTNTKAHGGCALSVTSARKSMLLISTSYSLIKPAVRHRSKTLLRRAVRYTRPQSIFHHTQQTANTTGSGVAGPTVTAVGDRRQQATGSSTSSTSTSSAQQQHHHHQQQQQHHQQQQQLLQTPATVAAAFTGCSPGATSKRGHQDPHPAAQLGGGPPPPITVLHTSSAPGTVQFQTRGRHPVRQQLTSSSSRFIHSDIHSDTDCSAP